MTPPERGLTARASVTWRPPRPPRRTFRRTGRHVFVCPLSRFPRPMCGHAHSLCGHLCIIASTDFLALSLQILSGMALSSTPRGAATNGARETRPAVSYGKRGTPDALYQRVRTTPMVKPKIALAQRIVAPPSAEAGRVTTSAEKEQWIKLAFTD